MIGRVVLIAASLLWGAAFYLRRKQQFYRDLFKTLKNCQKYHMDYVEDTTHLPLNQNIVIYGPPISKTGQNIISPSFIKKSSDQDRLWKMKLKNPFNFNTASNQPIQVSLPLNNEILVFNLPPTQRQLSDIKYEERAIIDGVGICAYGKVSHQGIDKKITMIPQLIIGNKHQSLLTFLDKQIVNFSGRSKILTAAGALLVVGHGLYYHFIRQKSEIEKQIQQFKSE